MKKENVFTWKDLAESINNMPEDQQNKQVIIWGEDTPVTPTLLSVVYEDMYFGRGWDNCYPKSELAEFELESKNTWLEVEEGTYYLDIS